MSYYRKFSFVNYSTLGSNCLNKTIAATSNTKFLLPLNNYYYEKNPKYNLNFKTEQQNEDIYSEFNVNDNQNAYDIENKYKKNNQRKIEDLKTFHKGGCTSC